MTFLQPKSAYSDRDSHEVKMDLNVEMVAAVEAKVASVRETLGEMAMSEQYMRTKRAQLLARTREREAQLATALAEQKEKEAEVRNKIQIFWGKGLAVISGSMGQKTVRLPLFTGSPLSRFSQCFKSNYSYLRCIRHVMAFLMLMPQNSFQVGFYFTGFVHADINSLQAMS